MTRAVGILGLGHYVPEKIITNTDMEKIVETSDEWITERTGIKRVTSLLRKKQPPIWRTMLL